MLLVPTTAVPSQSLQVSLDGQAVSLNLYTLSDDYLSNPNLYLDVMLGTQTIKTCLRCSNLARLLANCQYSPFIGDFVFVDMQGTSDPQYAGLGSRYQLVYLEAADLATIAPP